MKRSPLVVIFVTVFIDLIGFGIVIPVLPVYAKSEFHLTPSQMGWLVGVFSLVQLVASPIFGKISDRIGRKPVLIISIVGTAIGFFILGIAHSAWMLFLGRIIDGISGGNIFHGEMSLDQMFVLRPVAGCARYRTPIQDLWLCGSGAHPGGGVMGAPGYNAAREILKDGK